MPQPFQWARIVWASRRLTPSQKLVWDQLRLLDNGEGTYVKLDRLARRVGLDARTVEGIRQQLVKFDLVRRERQGRDRWHWLVRLPEVCLPSARPTDEEVFAFADTLDAWLDVPVPTLVPVPKTPPPDVPTTTRGGVPSRADFARDLTTGRGGATGGGKGEGIPLENRALSSIPPSQQRSQHGGGFRSGERNLKGE